MSGARRSELRHEQANLDLLYRRLDALRQRAARQLETVRRTGLGTTPANLSERDAFASLYEDRLAQLAAVEERLCFGRLDLGTGVRRYVGRIGLTDDDGEQLLVDWRAPAAEPFYQATAANPRGVVRRRHLVTSARTVTAVEDDVLDLDALDGTERDSLHGEGALLAALTATRSGRMRDIVATIQAEQDRVIRAELSGVLVVAGGPGTGKTAVALHRAAYLLYTHRERLARRGVLLVGPSPTFLRYIGAVLPSLGETGVVMSTIGSLLPGIDATASEDDRVAALKGDARMATVIARAVAARQRLPAQDLHLDVDGRTVVLRRRVVASARARARARGKPHNLTRTPYLLGLLDHLAGELAGALGIELTEDTKPALLEALREAPDVRRELNLLWMPLTPARVLADLYADPARLEAAGQELHAGERALLRRDRDASWTPADVPLLDEAAELLGEDDTAAVLEARRAAVERARELAYARGVLETFGAGHVSAEMLADRFADSGPVRTVAERATDDRTWTYGHVIVDEAQELSPMAWRALMRRCPSRSMTVVGDLAQTSSLAGASSWEAALAPYVAGRWQLRELTVNYRTPRQVMELAADTLAAAARAAGTPLSGTAPRSAREGAWDPVIDRVADEGELVPAIAKAVVAERAVIEEGRIAVITACRHLDLVTRALSDSLGPATVATPGTALEAPVTVLTPVAAKGLEVDTVVLVEPGAILDESPLGARDLYVAMTRCTQRLRVLHSTPVPLMRLG